MLEKEIAGVWTRLKEVSPLIHCITNPISINDCANIVLAAGAKPIMAEHPEEVAEITKASDALAVNLGNITDARINSMKISGMAARDKGINVIIDIVGTACSSLRLNYARKYIEAVKPSVVKGNISELKALSGIENFACGIDVGEEDALMTNEQIVPFLKKLALEYDTVILASGKIDYITDGKAVFAVSNGSPRMTQVTGTGCMLNVLTASFSAVSEPMVAAVSAAAVFGLCGELADKGQGIGSYHIALLDEVSKLTPEMIAEKARVEGIE